MKKGECMKVALPFLTYCARIWTVWDHNSETEEMQLGVSFRTL